MKPLYALIQQHRELEQLDPEEIDEATLLATLEGLQGEIALKAKSVAAYVRNIECFAEAVEDAAAKMQARADRLNARATKVKQYLLQQMESIGVSEIKSPEFTIKIKKNPSAVVIEEPDKIPEKYKYMPKVEPSINKTAIKADIEKGDEVPGATLRQGRRIDIKE